MNIPNKIPVKIKSSKLMEWVWFATGLTGAFISVYDTVRKGAGEVYVFYILTVLSFLFFFIRKNYRHKLEKKLNE